MDFSVKWCSKQEYPCAHWHDTILKVVDTLHNKTYYVDFDDYEKQLCDMGCSTEAEKAIEAFLEDDFYRSLNIKI